MRLVLLLSNKQDNSISLEKADVVLTNSYILYEKNKLASNINLVDFSLCDEEDFVREHINKLFNELPDEFASFRNTYYMRIFRPICSIITQIENLIDQYPIDEMILTGGSMHVFLTLKGGEGEGRKMLYESSWLLNPVIYSYFKNKVKITWHKRRNSFLFKCWNYLRENIFLITWLIKQIKYSFHKPPVISIASGHTATNAVIVAVADLPLQYKHLSDLLSRLNIDTYFITPSSSLVAKKHDPHIIPYKVFDIKSFVSNFFKYRRNIGSALKKPWIEFHLKSTKLPMNTRLFLKILCINYFSFAVRLLESGKVVRILGKDKDRYMVSDMTFGDDIILVKTLAQQTGCIHFNFQAVTMNKMIIPQLDLADRYFMYASRTMELYNKYHNHYEFYFPTQPTFTKKEDSFFTIAVFTQPDAYTDQYLELLKKLLPQIKNRIADCKVVIKPHYRQDRLNEFTYFTHEYDFVEVAENTQPPNHVLENADFMLSMTSSVLFEAITLGCPGIILDIDRKYTQFIYDNDSCFPQINFVANSIDEIINILQSSKHYSELYYLRREEWLAANKNISIDEIFNIDQVK